MSVSRRTFIAAVAALLGMPAPELPACEAVSRSCESVRVAVTSHPLAERREVEAEWDGFSGSWMFQLPAGCTIDAVRIECVSS